MTNGMLRIIIVRRLRTNYVKNYHVYRIALETLQIFSKYSRYGVMLFLLAPCVLKKYNHARIYSNDRILKVKNQALAEVELEWNFAS